MIRPRNLLSMAFDETAPASAGAGRRAVALVARQMARAEWESRLALMAVLDLCGCIMSGRIAYWLRTGEWSMSGHAIVWLFAITAGSWFAINWFVGTYHSLVRYFGSRTMIHLMMAGALQAAVLAVAMSFVPLPGVPRTIAILQPIVMVSIATLIRAGGRFVLTGLPGEGAEKRQRRVIIYGAGRAGQQLGAALANQPAIRLCAFVDDDARLRGRRIEGVPIHDGHSIEDVIVRFGANEVMLAMPSASRQRRREIITKLADLNVRVRTLPDLSQLFGAPVSAADLHEVNVVELLGREPVAPDRELLGAVIAGRTVMLTGAGGSIGAELAEQIFRAGARRLILVEMTEYALFTVEQSLRRLQEAHSDIPLADVEIIPELANCTDQAAVARLFRKYRPETVFHAAAYKHVPLVEQNPVSGVCNNVFGTLQVAETAEANGTRNFILVSTDKAVRPTSLMGASKRICEMILQAMNARGSKTVFAMVRFGNVLGSSGSVVPMFRQQIAAGGPVTITDRAITRFFMTIPEAAQLVIQAGGLARGGEVFLLDMGEPVRIIDLATSMIRLYGHTVRSDSSQDGDIEIVEIGLRPGEKLFEELLIDSDAKPTRHPAIFQANEAVLPWADLAEALGRLRQAAQVGDAETLRAIVRDLVPEYGASGTVAVERRGGIRELARN